MLICNKLTSPRVLESPLAILALAVLTSTAWTPVAQGAEFPPTIELSTLDGDTGFKTGTGRVIAAVGDINGDGYEDFAIANAEAGFNGSESGAVFVVLGKASSFSSNFDLSTLDGKNGFRLLGGAAGDHAGRSVASAGDVNDDGFDDIVVGASGTDSMGANSGSVYVVFGKAQSFLPSVNLAMLNGSNGFRLDGGKAGDFTGTSVASAGDINGDSFSDIVVKAPGADPNGLGSGSAYVVFGKQASFSPIISLSTLNGADGFELEGEAAGDSCFDPVLQDGNHAGYGGGVASAGDFNGDGLDDVIVGFPCKPTPGNYHTNLGSSYIVYGKTGGFLPSIQLSSLTGSDGFRIDGGQPSGSFGQYAYVGSSVAGAGDINGDGFDDVALGQYCIEPECNADGDSYVVFGSGSVFGPVFTLSSLNGTNGFTFLTPDEFEYSMSTVGSAGDVNGDGFADVVFGNDYAGSAHIVFGKASAFADSVTPTDLDGVSGFSLVGASPFNWSGWSASGTGDINGDGFADLGLTAESGTYVVFGRAPDSARTRNGSAASQYISGGQFNDTLKSKSGWDVVEGRGGGDILIGGPGSDLASYVHAPVGVRANLAAPASNTGDAAGDAYSEIEGLIGSRFADRLIGNAASNRIQGGLGRDVMTGGPGPDVFLFGSFRDSRAGGRRDIITDFEAGSIATSVDKINLGEIDAVVGSGNQIFRFIGQTAFSSTAGELRLQISGTSTIVMGDVNGDAAADLEIELQNFTNTSALTALDFIR